MKNMAKKTYPTTSLSRQALLAKIHIGIKALDLPDEVYRGMLLEHTGQNSAKDADADGLERVLKSFLQMGFKPTAKGSSVGKKSTRPIIRLIFGLWKELGNKKLIDNPTRSALLAFVKKQTGVDHPDWLDVKQAQGVVEALKAMRDRPLKTGD